MPEMNVEQDIARLEQQLAEKRSQLEREGTAESGPSEHEMVHEAVGERIKERMPQYEPAPAPTAGAPAADDDAGASWRDPAIAQQVQSLVNIAFTKNLDEAVGEAVKTNNAAIIDAFHDLLRDELFKELVARGKLKPPAAG